MAGTIKGMTIEIGGNTAPLEQALKDVNKDINSTQKELKEVDKLLKFDPQNTTLLKQKMELLNNQIGNTTTKLDALKQAQKQLDDTVAKGGEINQAEYRKLEREIATTQSSLSKLKDQASKTGDQLSGASEKAKKMAEATKKVGEVAVTCTKALVDFTTMGIKAMTGAIAGAIGVLTKLTKDAGEFADEMNTLASKTGLTTKQLQEFQYASDLIDVSVDTLATSLKKTTSAMVSAKDGTGASAEAFKTLGVNIKNADGTLRDNNDVFNESIRALGNIANETERDALAMQIFGKSATELNPLIEGGIDTLDEMSKKANELGLVLSQDAVDGANAFNDQLDILKSNGKGLFTVIGSEIASSLVPNFKELNETTEGYIKRLTDAMNEGGIEGLLEEAGNVIGDLVTKITEKLPQIAELGIKIIKTLVSSLKENASQIGTGAGTLYTTIVEGFYTILPDVIDLAIKLVTSFIKTIGENLPELIPTVVQALTDVLNTIIDNIDIVIETGLTVIEGLITGLLNALPILLEQAPIIIQKFLDTITEQLPKIWETVNGLILQVVDFMLKPENLELFINTAVQIIEVIAKALVENLPTLIEAGIKITKQVFEALIGKVISAGENLVKGLWEGIAGVKDWILKKIRGLCQQMLQTITGFFGINSPSTVMADQVGKYMAQGIGVGFGNTMPSVIKAMQDKLDSVTSSLQSEISFGEIPQLKGNQIISENQYITRNYSNTVETIRQPSVIELVLDNTKVARALVPALDNEYNRLGVKV